jgi:hypothetical protein
MVAPLEKYMGGVNDTNKQSGKDPAPKAEPEGRENDGKVVKALVNVMKGRPVERRQVVKQTDADDETHQQEYAQHGRFIHIGSHSGLHPT